MLMLVGWIVTLVILKSHWELTFGKLIGVVLLFMIFATMASLAYGIAYYGIVILAVLAA
jgi:hypothetical protein